MPEPRAPEPLWPEPRRPEPRWPDAPPLPTVRVRFGSVAGCLGRLVLLALFLLVLAGLAFFWTIGAFAPFAPEPGPWVEAAAAAEWTPSG